MSKSKVLILLVFVIILIVISLVYRVFTQTEEPLAATCATLSATIAGTPGIDVGQADYETYANLGIPPLSPEEALTKFELEEGFRIEVVAHEPMVVDPVAMDIDHDGRLWVVDMPSYMPVPHLGEWETAAREQVPMGRVVVLEDTNKDGKMDKKRVFRDELILPRAIKVLTDGILIAEPPYVWFIQDTNGDGKGDSREIVYYGYGDPTINNVEHMPNGLMWGMDNWLHSVHSDVESLRRIDGEWQTRPFQQLGQWGITHNDWGRLFSSHNTNPLQTHLVPYGYSQRHPLFESNAGKNLNIAPDTPMWPAHPTGLNRGYRLNNEVREDGTLLRATATAGPVIYRGTQFGDNYIGDAFVPEPAGNLIKRYLIHEDPSRIEAEAVFAYENMEFLTSTDERFRPVNMYNAPDGSLYVIDMYRGLFQHARYLTEHLREYVMENELYKPYGKFGRIYRIVRDDRPIDYDAPQLSTKTPTELVAYLQNQNGQIRDQAQQLLVQCSPSVAVSSLREMVENETTEYYSRLHALWILEGYDRNIYSREQLTGLALTATSDAHPAIRASAIRILEPELAGNSDRVIEHLGKMVDSESSEYVKLQLLASLGESTGETALRLMISILDKHVTSVYFREMALTGVFQQEQQMTDIIKSEYGWSHDLSSDHDSFLSSLTEAMEELDEMDDALAHLTERHRNLYDHGRVQYQTCQACHGSMGQGVANAGSPLAGSEWVHEDPEKLVRITLQGLEGAAEERGESIPALMPAHSFMSDEAVAAVLTFIRQSWGNEAPPIEPEEVAEIREASMDRNEIWTPDELRNLPE